MDSGKSVLLLESGGFDEEPATQDLYAGAVVDARLHSPPDRYRQRRFGGTTTIWGGRCMPFDPIDFETREYVPASGWPIGRPDLDAYYVRANSLCEAGPFAYTTEESFGAPAAHRRRLLQHGFLDASAGALQLPDELRGALCSQAAARARRTGGAARQPHAHRPRRKRHPRRAAVAADARGQAYWRARRDNTCLRPEASKPRGICLSIAIGIRAA